MNKLDESRVNRTIVEHIAATIIQKVFRGHQVRALDTDSPPAHSEDGTVKERVFYLRAERRRALENEKRQHRAATDLVKAFSYTNLRANETGRNNVMTVFV